MSHDSLMHCQEQLEKYSQEQLLRFQKELSSTELQSLCEQIEAVDFEELDGLIKKALQQSAGEEDSGGTVSPLENSIRLSDEAEQPERFAQAREAGTELLNAGRVGAVLVAGGQGSRLGFPHPKGMYPIGPITERTLFQIFFEQLLALTNRHNVRIPYFIMTSDATHEETLEFLEQHAYFGYPSEDVFLFKQGKMPAVDDQTGKVLLADRSTIAMSPDGHGGLIAALQKAKLFEEMQSRGVDTLFYHQVDNPCVKICDPTLLGFHAIEKSEITTKVVAKREPLEKVGILAQADGKQSIIEYSDLPDELAHQTDDQDRLVYWAGNIAIHVMNRQLLERLASGKGRLPVHIAHKKVAHVNEAGAEVSPESPNAYKFERFIFDAIPRAEQPLVMETSREEEFNPVKNAEGNDSPASSRAALLAQARSWMKQAGYDVQEDQQIEISPLIALSPEDLKGEVSQDQLSEKEVVLVPDSV